MTTAPVGSLPPLPTPVTPVLHEVLGGVGDLATGLLREVTRDPVGALRDSVRIPAAVTWTVAGDLVRFGKQASKRWVESFLADPSPDLLHLLRTAAPVLMTPGLAVVTRAEDVRDILTHDQVFTVDPYRAPMREVTGDFILCLDSTPQYEHDASILRLAFPQADAERIRGIVTAAADELVAAHAGTGELDVVSDLADLVPVRFAAEYLGLPGPSAAQLVAWCRVTFAEIFTNLARDRSLSEAAQDAAAQLRPYVEALIADIGRDLDAGTAVADTVLSRLVRFARDPAFGWTPTDVRNNIIGLVIGAVPTTSKAATRAIDQLLRRPQHLAAAQQAAQDGDIDRVRRYVREALRFAPHNPALLRHAQIDYTIGAGRWYATRIPAGTVVYAATSSAMFDERVVPDPQRFDPDRPDHQYLHYGTGLHTCFGRVVNDVQLPAIAAALLRRPGLRRVSGPAGELHTEGNWPVSLRVAFA